jgi:hypothetical protein
VLLRLVRATLHQAKALVLGRGAHDSTHTWSRRQVHCCVCV